MTAEYTLLTFFSQQNRIWKYSSRRFIFIFLESHGKTHFWAGPRLNIWNLYSVFRWMKPSRKWGLPYRLFPRERVSNILGPSSKVVGTGNLCSSSPCLPELPPCWWGFNSLHCNPLPISPSPNPNLIFKIKGSRNIDDDVSHHFGWCEWNIWRLTYGILFDKKYHLNLNVSFTYRWIDYPCCMGQSVGQSRNIMFKRCMLRRWGCPNGWYTRSYKIRNEVIWENVEVTSMVGKMREARLRWFEHV